MIVRLTPEAQADLREAHAWYASREPRLGAEFLTAFEAVVRQIRDYPESAPEVQPEIRRALLHRFPYCVFYVFEPPDAVVLGCFHARRDPEVWRLRARS